MPFGGKPVPEVTSNHQYNVSMCCFKCGDKFPSERSNSRDKYREKPDKNPANTGDKAVFIANSKVAKELFKQEFECEWELKPYSPYFDFVEHFDLSQD